MSVRKRFLLIALLCLGVFGALYCFYDNTDRATHSLRTHDAELFMIASSNPDLYNELDLDKDLDEKLEAYFKTNEAENSCLKDPKATKTPKDQLESFVQGDCAPIIFVPGLMATRLVVEIDCEVLNEYHPEIMEACGWKTCSWSLWSKKPSTEYTLWISSVLTPMSMLTITNNTCFGRLIGNNYQKMKHQIHEKYQEIEGLSITWYGNTPETFKYANGGFGAVSNLLPLPVQTSETKGFAGMAKYLTKLGYQTGLSVFALPYDFRKTHRANSISYTLERTIRYAYELTGKKVVLVGHSLGNLNTLPVLMKMSQEDKDKMIALYVSAGAPFGGASKPTRLMIGGDQGFIFKNLIGFQYFNQKSIMAASSSGFDLLPKDHFYRFKDEPWMKELIARVELENKYDPSTEEGTSFWKDANQSELPLPFFPTAREKCFEGYLERPEECMTLLTDLKTTPVVAIEDNVYYANYSSLRKLLEEYITLNDFETALGKYHDSLASNVQEFGNPQVPVVYLYGTHLETELLNYWNYDPKVKTNQDAIAKPTQTFHRYGDETVEVSFSLPIAIKWAWEHTHGVNNSKPVKIAEYCSTYNRKGKVWDTTDQNGANLMNKTEYIGAPCACQNSLPGNGKACAHAGMLGDPQVIEFVADLAVTKEKADLSSTAARRLPNDKLIELQEELPYLRKSRYDQEVKSWLYMNYPTVLTE